MSTTLMQRLKASVKARAPQLVPAYRLGKSMVWRVLPMKYRFQRIYRDGTWGSRDQSSSGTGSNLPHTTAIRARLPELLDNLGVGSLIDIPCGDFFWLKEVDLAKVTYLGADIVPELVETNKRRYGNTPARRFVTLDITKDALPKMDMILCRDCLVHLSNRDALSALRNIKKSGSKYLLATTFPSQAENVDIVTGYWRPINLENPPFRLPKPSLTINESSPDTGRIDKSLGLWNIADL